VEEAMITVSATAGGVELVREIELARQVEDMVDRNVVMRIVMREALSSRVADRKVGVLIWALLCIALHRLFADMLRYSQVALFARYIDTP
jgi:hypothetical protein